MFLHCQQVLRRAFFSQIKRRCDLKSELSNAENCIWLQEKNNSCFLLDLCRIELICSLLQSDCCPQNMVKKSWVWGLACLLPEPKRAKPLLPDRDKTNSPCTHPNYCHICKANEFKRNGNGKFVPDLRNFQHSHYWVLCKGNCWLLLQVNNKLPFIAAIKLLLALGPMMKVD